LGSGIITLLTDFGTADHYVGVMKGVMAGINPAARFIDISHEVQAYSIWQGAFFVAQSYAYFPPDAVHLIVVDPGVGTARRPIAARAAGQLFIAPDNGVLSQLYEREAAEVRVIDTARFALDKVSNTFHGRDIFSPAAAHLSRGTAFEQIGEAVTDFVRLPGTQPLENGSGRWKGRILNIDRFGNIVTSFSAAMAAKADGFRVRAGKLEAGRLLKAYGEAGGGEPFAIIGSSGYVELSINQASAAAQAEVKIGDEAELFSAPAW